MLILGQRHYRDKLDKLIGKTSLVVVVGLAWSDWPIRNGQADSAGHYMRFPAAAEMGQGRRRGAAVFPFRLFQTRYSADRPECRTRRDPETCHV